MAATSGALYKRVFSISDVAQTHKLFIEAVEMADEIERVYARIGRPGMGASTARTLLRAYGEFNRELDELAATTAVDAKRRILSILALRQKRPNTGMGPHLRGAIICRPIRDLPLATGEVGIADIAKLDSVVNPFGPQYGPYWRAIEEGTSKHVGRQVVGGFFGTGLGSGPFKPNPGDFRSHPIFVTSAQGRSLFADTGFGGGGFGKEGGAGGRRMTIRRAIDPQHFIRDGATLTATSWRRGVAAIEAHARRQIAAVARLGP